jgi:hypothetical protein
MEKPNSDTTIYGLFGQTGRQFAVPPFQRAYAWEVDGGKQVVQFLRDIQEQPMDRAYYLGHFLFEGDERQLLVIDGQQRLTTIVLFMGMLVAECERRGNQQVGGMDVAEIREIYLKHRVQKFKTVPEDASYFDARVVDGKMEARCTTGRRSEKQLAEAVAFFAKAFANAQNSELSQWFTTLNDARITTYTIEGMKAKEIATQIFAFQNDRGKPLTMLEKTKAWLMHQVYRQSEAEDVNDNIRNIEFHFSVIYGLIEALHEQEDTVLGWHCQAYLDENASGGLALETIKKVLAEETDKAGWIKSFTAKLAETFRFVANLEKIEERREGLVADICYLGKTSAMPLLVKLGHFHLLDLDEQPCKALEPIENILFKLTFTTGDYRTNLLVHYARKFNGENYETYLLPTLRDAAVNGFKPYWDFTGNCRGYFTENRWHYVSKIKYVLYKYENYLRKNAGEPALDISECQAIFREKNKSVENTLDHIAPQTPDYTEYTDEFRHRFLCNIGNLSLLTWANNARKSNRNPADPSVRKRYDTPYRAQRAIFKMLESGTWGETEIESRRREIVKFVIEHWKLGAEA